MLVVYRIFGHFELYQFTVLLDVSSIQDIWTFSTISNLYVKFSVLNCLKYFKIYILGHLSQKVRQEKCAELF